MFQNLAAWIKTVQDLYLWPVTINRVAQAIDNAPKSKNHTEFFPSTAHRPLEGAAS